MRVLHKDLYYPSRSSTIRLYYLTDLHLGARACAEKLLARDIQRIADDPHAYWIGGGDYLDCIARKGDKRFNESTLAKWLHGEDDVIDLQVERAVSMLTPIANKCLGLVEGNHERAALTYYDRNVYRALCRRLAEKANVDPASLMLGVHGFIRLNFRRKDSTGTIHDLWRYTIYCHHGYGGGRLAGGHALTLERTLGDYDANLVLMGHRHTRVYTDKSIVRVGSQGVTTDLRMAMFVPSYLRAYVIPSSDKYPIDTYAEHLGLPPKVLGTTPIEFVPDKRRVRVEISNDSGGMEQAAG